MSTPSLCGRNPAFTIETPEKTKRIAPADAGAFFEEAEKPCASGKIFCVKNGGSACYFGAAVLIYKYHSNVPGRVVCFGKAGKVFSTEYADRGAGLMRTRNNGQAAVSGRGGTAEGAAACLGGVSWAVGEYPADCHKICGALSRRIFQRRLRPVALCALCAQGFLFFSSLCPCVGAEGLRQNTGGGTV